MTEPASELISDRWLRRARRVNPFIKERLRWRLPAGWPEDIASGAFARRVAAFQTEHGRLTVDGVLGPKTWEAMQGRIWRPPLGEHLIIRGERLAVPFPVVTWLNPSGMSFYGRRAWSKRKRTTGANVDLFVLHWDGCTSSHQCFQVLLERGLSVHLMLDGDGTVYQALDLAEARAWHAGNVNERSIGVEIQNPVQVHRNRWQDPLRDVVMDPGVHGGPAYEHLDFYEVQKRRIVQLAEVLCDRFHIRRKLPLDASGEVLETLAPAGFSGVCGHYHVSTAKLDPGSTLWPTLQAAFVKAPATNESSHRSAVA